MDGGASAPIATGVGCSSPNNLVVTAASRRAGGTLSGSAKGVIAGALRFFFVMFHLKICDATACVMGYFAGLTAMKLHTPVVNPDCMTHPQPRTLGQGRDFLSQKPRQVVP